MGSIPTNTWVLIFWRTLSVRCSTLHCSEVLNDNMHEWFRLNEDACKTTQAYDTMEKRRATYPGMRGIAWLPRQRRISKTRNCKRNDRRSGQKPDDLLRMSEGKEHAVSLVSFFFLHHACADGESNPVCLMLQQRPYIVKGIQNTQSFNARRGTLCLTMSRQLRVMLNAKAHTWNKIYPMKQS